MNKATINKLYSCKDNIGIYGFKMREIGINKNTSFNYVKHCE